MNRRSSGLTLLELLLSLAILAIIVAALASSLRLSIRSWEQTAAISRFDQQVALRIRLRLWLETAAPGSLIADFPLTFEGSARTFNFTTLSVTSANPEATATRIEMAESSGQILLRLTELDEEGNEVEKTERILADGLQDIVLSYFESMGDQPGWKSVWTDPNRLPALVRITAAPGSQPDWPDFTVRLAYAD